MELVRQNEVIDLPITFDDVDESKEITHVDYVGDGLIYSLKNYGKVDIDYISEITGISKDEVIDKLSGSIYQDPEEWNLNSYMGYKTADEYLSGNLLTKLNKAMEANRMFPNRFRKNIDAIKSILPREICYEEIFYSLASPWIPKDLIIIFAKSAFPRFHVKIHYNDFTELWKIEDTRSSYSYDYRFSSKTVNGIAILEKILNNKSLAVYHSYKDLNNKTIKILDEEETILVEKKAKELQACFKRFIEDSKEYKNKLIEAYNNKFGYNVARTYDGSFLSFPGLNPKLNLFDYQKNAIARIIFNDNTLLAHAVGNGKTYTMIAAGEEMLRMGISDKNLYVVPNNILSQWKEFYDYAYPNANVFFATTNHFTPTNKEATLRLIKNGNYKTVVMSYSSFDLIPMSYDVELSKLNSKLEAYNLANQNINPFCDAQASNLAKRLKERIKEIEEEKKTASILNKTFFEDLGFTRLFLDEAHNYKNLPLETNLSYIRGINVAGSKKCEHLKMVCEYISSLKNGGIIMATGTPITNSISDIYVFQSFLQSGELKLLDIPNFDAWISMFAELTPDYEIDLDTKSYRRVQRLNKFHNLPELAQILSSIADFHFNSKNDDIPLFKGYSDILIPKSIYLSEYLAKISERVDLIRRGLISRKEDNMLKITTDGRKAALDLRLVDEATYNNVPSSKIKSCAINIANIYLKTKSFKGTQLVFCDSSIPKTGFNVYDALKNELVNSYNIPENEIAYVHDATTDRKRNSLFEKMRNGDIRILIGSTFKLGVGVNVQNKLYAIHHLDIPWRPADMVQREGRILRQGNLNEEVFIYRYIAQSSFDAYSWQLLEIKQKFISELLSNSINERTKEDIQDTILNYGEVKALAIGNPKLKEHVEVKNELSKLKILSKKENDEYARKQRRLLEIPQNRINYENKVNSLTNDIALYNVSKADIDLDKKNEIRSLIWTSLFNHINKPDDLELLEYQGFKVFIPKEMSANYMYIILKGYDKHFINIGNSERGIVTRMDNYLNGLEAQKEEIEERIRSLAEEEKILINNLKNKNDYTERIIELSEKLQELEKGLGLK